MKTASYRIIRGEMMFKGCHAKDMKNSKTELEV